MPELEDDDLFANSNKGKSLFDGADTGNELTPEAKNIAALLDAVAEDPTLLDKDPKLKEFYDFAVKAKDATVEDNRIIIEDKLDKVNQRVQEEFGYDTIDELIEASKKWKNGSDVFDQWNSLIQNAPNSFGTAVSLYLQGSPDWNKAIALDTKVDFSKPVTNQDKKELIKFYFPNQFTEDELKEVNSTDDEALKKASRLAEGFFAKEHQNYTENLKRATDKQKESVNAQKAALDKNKELLKKKYPKLTESQATKIINSLMNGSYARHFLNADGIFAEKAAENLIALELPDFYINNVIGKTREEQNKEKMNILNRSAEIPGLKGKVAAPQKEKQPHDITLQLLQKKKTYEAKPVK